MSDAPRLRILVVGASGVLGRAVVAELGARHEIIAAGSSRAISGSTSPTRPALSPASPRPGRSMRSPAPPGR